MSTIDYRKQLCISMSKICTVGCQYRCGDGQLPEMTADDACRVVERSSIFYVDSRITDIQYSTIGNNDELLQVMTGGVISVHLITR